MNNPIIRINNLSKSYGRLKVLREVDLDIEPGQILGYIGPNGAGKSTTVRILAGLDSDFEGEVFVDGIDVKKDPLAVKKIIGYVPEVNEMYDTLTAMEFLKLIGGLHKIEDDVIQEKAERMLKFFDLEKNMNHRMNSYSKGMKQKVLLISGLLHDPKIIFLDEPLAGLDANSVILVKELLNRLAEDGKTIFYCSHMMDVVEKISDRIILLYNGKVFADGTFSELKELHGGTLEKIFSKLTNGRDIESKIDQFFMKDE